MKKCTISGSFNHHYNSVTEFHGNLSQEKNYKILSPKDMNIRDQSTDFILLKSDISNKINQIEESHLKAISKSDLLYVVNPKDYIGISTALEIGYARALNIPIKFFEKSRFNFQNNIVLNTIKNNNIKILIQNDDKTNRCYSRNFKEDLSKKFRNVIISSQYAKINNFKNSDFFLINNPTGNININNAFKIGYAYALNIPIIFTQKPSDILLKEMTLSNLDIKSFFNLKCDFNILTGFNVYSKEILKSFISKYKFICQLI